MNAAQCYIAGLILFAVSLLAIISAVRGRRQNKPVALNFFLGKTFEPTRRIMRAHTTVLFIIAMVAELLALSFLIRAMMV
jgi:hypothetical protein